MNARLMPGIALLFLATFLRAGEDPVAPPPKDQDPTVAERGYFEKSPRAWNDFHKAFLERAKLGGIELLFLGDSILQGWGDSAQKDLWKLNFDAYKLANFSVGGDRTQQILWRIDNGELDGLTPKVVVLEIGGNNLWSNDKPEKIADGIKKIVELIRKKLPAAKVLVLGILPAQKSNTDGIRDKIKQVNAQTAKLDDGASIRFLDIGANFTDANGVIDLDKELYQPDYVHLKTKGYEAWATAVKPVLAELMK